MESSSGQVMLNPTSTKFHFQLSRYTFQWSERTKQGCGNELAQILTGILLDGKDSGAMHLKEEGWIVMIRFSVVGGGIFVE